MMDHDNATEEDYAALADRLREIAADAGWMPVPNQVLIDNLMDAAMAIEELKFRIHCNEYGSGV